MQGSGVMVGRWLGQGRCVPVRVKPELMRLCSGAEGRSTSTAWVWDKCLTRQVGNAPRRAPFMRPNMDLCVAGASASGLWM